MLCSALLCYAMLCYTILYHTILYFNMISYTILYSDSNPLERAGRILYGTSSKPLSQALAWVTLNETSRNSSQHLISIPYECAMTSSTFPNTHIPHRFRDISKSVRLGPCPCPMTLLGRLPRRVKPSCTGNSDERRVVFLGSFPLLLESSCGALLCTVLYCTVLYCTVLYCTVLYCTIRAILYYTRLD